MKISAVKNFTFFRLHVFPFICKFFYYLLSFVSIISYLLYTQISVVILRFTTSEDVCWNITSRQSLFPFQICVYISLCLSPRFAFCFFLTDWAYDVSIMTYHDVTMTSQSSHFEFWAAILNPEQAVIQLTMTTSKKYMDLFSVTHLIKTSTKK